MGQMRRGSGIAVALLALALAPSARANGAERLEIRPAAGGPKTVFAFDHRDLGPLSGPEDEVLYVVGPRRTRCEGRIVVESIAGEGRRERYRIGPGAEIAPAEPASGDALPRWCRGRYKVVIKYETNDGEDRVAVARGRFRVG